MAAERRDTTLHVSSATISFDAPAPGDVVEGVIQVPPPPIIEVDSWQEPFEQRFYRLFQAGQRHFSIIHFDPTSYMKFHLHSPPQYSDEEQKLFHQKLLFCLETVTPGWYIKQTQETYPIFYFIATDDM